MQRSWKRGWGATCSTLILATLSAEWLNYAWSLAKPICDWQGTCPLIQQTSELETSSPSRTSRKKVKSSKFSRSEMRPYLAFFASINLWATRTNLRQLEKSVTRLKDRSAIAPANNSDWKGVWWDKGTLFTFGHLDKYNPHLSFVYNIDLNEIAPFFWKERFFTSLWK